MSTFQVSVPSSGVAVNIEGLDEFLNAPTTKVNMPSGTEAIISKPVSRPCRCSANSVGQRMTLTKLEAGWFSWLVGVTEYDIVEAEMHRTLAHHFTGYNIISIEKVHNCCLWEKFRNREREIARELRNKYVNEVMLFHGTSVPDVIIKTGFDISQANPNGMFGPGIYFAENSSKSSLYGTAVGGHRKMLLCRVALGQILDRTQGDRMTRPPPGYHSVRGLPTKGGSSKLNFGKLPAKGTPDGDGLYHPEYVVYHNDQAYPEYLVTYDIAG